MLKEYATRMRMDGIPRSLRVWSCLYLACMVGMVLRKV